MSKTNTTANKYVLPPVSRNRVLSADHLLWSRFVHADNFIAFLCNFRDEHWPTFELSVVWNPLQPGICNIVFISSPLVVAQLSGMCERKHCFGEISFVLFVITEFEQRHFDVGEKYPIFFHVLRTRKRNCGEKLNFAVCWLKLARMLRRTLFVYVIFPQHCSL